MITSLRRWHLALAMVTLLAILPAARAQQNSPGIGYVYPAGGRQGETFRVVVGGQYLTGAGAAYFSCDGVRAVVIEHNRPLTQKQFNELREQAKQLQERKPAATRSSRRAGQDPNGSQEIAKWTAEDEKLLAEIRKRLLVNAPNRQANPAISEWVTLEVTVASDAGPGRHELRLMAASGLSNPLVFCVGELPEFSEKPAQEIVEQRNPGRGDPSSDGIRPPQGRIRRRCLAGSERRPNGLCIERLGSRRPGQGAGHADGPGVAHE